MKRTLYFCSALLLLCALATTVRAQQCTQPSAAREWVQVCVSGNGIPALSRTVNFPADSITVEAAFSIIGSAIQRPVRFDLTSEQRQARIRPGSTPRTASEAIAIVSAQAGVRAESNRFGDLRVSPRPATPLSPVTVVASPASPVRRTTEQVGTTTTSMQELRQAPIIIAPDVLRLIRLLPGVSTRNDLSLDFNVRGGESAQNLVLVDGYPIYNPFHLGGVLGTFIEPAVGDVDLQAGAFPVRSSGRLSGLLTTSTRRDLRPGVRGSFDISLLAATAAVSRRSTDSARYWLLGARRTYGDVMANAVGLDLPYYFQDAHGYFEQSFSTRHRLSFTGVYSLDRSGQYKGEAKYRVGWGNTVLGATLRSAYPSFLAADSVTFEHRASYSGFDGFTRSADRTLDFDSRVSDVRVSSMATYARGVSSMEVGFDVGRITTAYSGSAPHHWLQNLMIVGSAASEQSAIGAWSAYALRTSQLQISLGLRADVVARAGSALSPRVALRSNVADNLALTFSAGQHVQWIHSTVRQEQPLRPLDFWMGGPTVPMARASIITAGIDRQSSDGRQLKVEGFYKRYSNLPDRSLSDSPRVEGDEFEPLQGTSKGFDLLLRPATANKWNGWLSYTLAFSERRDLRGMEFTPAHDRRHELNVVAVRQLGAWSASSRFNLASGTPYTLALSEFNQLVYDPATNVWGRRSTSVLTDEKVYITTIRNSMRLPMSHRLDLGIARTGRNGQSRAVPYFSIANAYGAPNPWLYYDEYGVTPERIAYSGFRWLPTFGFKYAF